MSLLSVIDRLATLRVAVRVLHAKPLAEPIQPRGSVSYEFHPSALEYTIICRKTEKEEK